MSHPDDSCCVKTLTRAASMQPINSEARADACADKHEAYLLAWAHFQHDLLALADELRVREMP